MTARYISTRGETPPLAFSDAVITGLAPDGGLLLPETIPDLSSELSKLRILSYKELCLRIMRPLVDIPDDILGKMITESYSTFRSDEITPIVPVKDLFILELFHGPTLAFKDVALQFLGNLFEYLNEQHSSELNILGATSGDTGSAAIQGVRSKKRIRIFVLHPNERISRVQKLQMTSVLDDNVFNIALQGTFDDCQSVMKEIFRDLEFKEKYSLGSINSINWARILAQIVYYFYGAFRTMDITGADKVSFAVPTGNFGDIFAGYMAVRMGLPVKHLYLATNENDILSRFFNTGTYSLGSVHKTLSPSMDIQVASNLERYLYYRCGQNSSHLRDLMACFAGKGSIVLDDKPGDGLDDLLVADSVVKEDMLSTIRDFYREADYILDPHTAVGVTVALRNVKQDIPTICLATAHPAKFEMAIKLALGKNAAHHDIIDKLEGLPSRCEVLPADSRVVKEYIRKACL